MIRALLFSAAVCIAFGCGRSSEPDTGEADGLTFLRCAEPYDDGAGERIQLPPLTVVRTGMDAAIHGIKRGLVVLGVLAGISEPSRGNLANLDFFLEQFQEAGAQAILVAGGVGLKEEHVDAILERLAKAPVPILVTPGAEENHDVFRRVIRKKREKHPQLLDMTAIRRVGIGHVNVVSLPGHAKPFYLAAQERGCGFQEEDARKTAELFDRRRPTVLLAPSPPRGIGERAVDRGQGGVNIGDPSLRRILEDEKVAFGVFGHVYESGGNATLSDGRTSAAPGIWHPSLFIQTGSADSLPLSLVGGGRSIGMAEIVEISANRARFRTVYAETAASAPGLFAND